MEFLTLIWLNYKHSDPLPNLPEGITGYDEIMSPAALVLSPQTSIEVWECGKCLTILLLSPSPEPESVLPE